MSSSSTPLPEEAARSYLIAQLQRDPAVHAPAIMRARTKALQLEPAKGAGVNADAHRKRWNKAKESLDALRKRIWTAPLPELEQELAQLPTAAFPDVAHAAERLRTVLANRDKLPALTQHKDFWVDFFNVFKDVLVSPPQEVSVLRERCVGMFRERSFHRKGVKMIAILESNTPEIYALEADWLRSLARQKPSRMPLGISVSETAETNSFEGIKRPPGWTYIVIAALTLRIVWAIFGER